MQDEDEESNTAPEEPTADDQAKAEKIARERERLLHNIGSTVTSDIRTQVGFVLSQFPPARDSDVALAHLVWETFYPEHIENGRVRLEDMYRIPRQTTMARIRAKIQNDYGLFQASADVQGFRRSLRAETKDQVVADKPGPPIVAVHADESGKKPHRFLVVGSVWVLNIAMQPRLAQALRNWKTEQQVTWELKFNELTKGKLSSAIEYVKTAMAHSDVMSLKACVLDTTSVKGLGHEDVLYRLYYELAMSGMEHEIGVGRVVLPRWLSLVKDADDGPDVLHLPELQRRLTATCREYFRDTVQVDSVITGDSEESPLLQLADLFSGSLSRVMNVSNESKNAKDDFAAFFGTVAGFDLKTGEKGPGDFVYVHRLT